MHIIADRFLDTWRDWVAELVLQENADSWGPGSMFLVSAADHLPRCLFPEFDIWVVFFFRADGDVAEGSSCAGGGGDIELRGREDTINHFVDIVFCFCNVLDNSFDEFIICISASENDVVSISVFKVRYIRT